MLNYLIYRAIGSSRKLGGAAEHLIDGSEKRICQLSFEFLSLVPTCAISMFLFSCAYAYAYVACVMLIAQVGTRL